MATYPAEVSKDIVKTNPIENCAPKELNDADREVRRVLVNNATRISKTVNYTIKDTDYMVYCTGNGDFTVTLPASATVSSSTVVKEYLIKNSREDKVIYLVPNGSELIDGRKKVIIFAGQTVLVIGNGVGWELVEYKTTQNENFFELCEEFLSIDINSPATGAVVRSDNSWYATGSILEYAQKGGCVRIYGDATTKGLICLASRFTPMEIVNANVPFELMVYWATDTGAGAEISYIGLASVATDPMPPNNGVYFRHAANGGNIFAVCRAAGVETTLDTGVATSDTVFHEGRLINTATGVAVYLDEVYIGEITTNIPTVLLAPFATVNSLSVTDTMIIDTFNLKAHK